MRTVSHNQLAPARTASKCPIAIDRPMMNPPIATSGEHAAMRNAGCIKPRPLRQAMLPVI